MENRSDRRYQAALVLGALGVVYGDIGTSPLYALRECFSAEHGLAASPHNVKGVVSLMLWTLMMVVSFKYLWLVMRADNHGEGGILALLALAVPSGTLPGWRGKGLLLGIGIFGAALLYGDGMLTPAVTVLGAMEGLEVVTMKFKPMVVPLSAVILVLLFMAQRFGTGRMGACFGPVMVVWFLVLGILGIRGICQGPEILAALSPWPGLLFLVEHWQSAFYVLGAVFLAVTGAEALYADMGHFGVKPIRRAWFTLVFPGLILNYLGQGALLLRKPQAAEQPFFLLAPSWAVLPLVVLATMAAIIASQALISGAYSLTMQAIQMGYLPRLVIKHTSQEERGQIYMPQVNTLLMVACVGLVIGFGSSSRLAGAYGIAVSLTMLATTVLLYAVERGQWNWPRRIAIPLCGTFLLMEVAFALANGLKILQGGWFPLTIGACICMVMTTWRTGRAGLRDKLAAGQLPFDLFLEEVDRGKALRVPGTAVFMAGNANGTPLAMLHNLKHNKVLHARVVVLTVVTENVPHVAADARVKVETLRKDFFRVTARYGFMEQPDVPQVLAACRSSGLVIPPSEVTYFISRETILTGRRGRMPGWRKHLFAAISRNATHATAFFRLPANRVVELGMLVDF